MPDEIPSNKSIGDLPPEETPSYRVTPGANRYRRVNPGPYQQNEAAGRVGRAVGGAVGRGITYALTRALVHAILRR